MGKLPVAPQYAKMILMACQENCLQYIIAIVAALTVKVCANCFRVPFYFLLRVRIVSMLNQTWRISEYQLKK